MHLQGEAVEGGSAALRRCASTGLLPCRVLRAARCWGSGTKMRGSGSC